jgi:hypothetical protein
MSRAATRKAAVEAADKPVSPLEHEPDVPGPGLRDWFGSLGQHPRARFRCGRGTGELPGNQAGPAGAAGDHPGAPVGPASWPPASYRARYQAPRSEHHPPRDRTLVSNAWTGRADRSGNQSVCRRLGHSFFRLIQVLSAGRARQAWQLNSLRHFGGSAAATAMLALNRTLYMPAFSRSQACAGARPRLGRSSSGLTAPRRAS